jgi:AcrR family transcriptional regulator
MKAGRPRSFDLDEALERVTPLFWRHGYDGTSLAELTQAMGINPPSLYAAFGSKKGLFRAVVERYVNQRGELMKETLSAPTAREAMERYLLLSADLAASSDPAGCLLLQSGLSSSSEENLPEELARHRKDAELFVRKRLERAKREGDLTETADPKALARYVTTVTQGMAVRAAAGDTRKELREIAAIALNAFLR